MLISFLNTKTGETSVITPTSVIGTRINDHPAIVINEASGRKTTVICPMRPDDEYNGVTFEAALQNILDQLYQTERTRISGRVREDDTRRLVVYNIKWDTDGYDVNLPGRIELKYTDLLYEEECRNTDLDEDELLERVSDYLSDTYGFCHSGFMITTEEAK